MSGSRTSAMGHEQTNLQRQSRVCLCSLNRPQSAAKLLPIGGVIGTKSFGRDDALSRVTDASAQARRSAESRDPPDNVPAIA
jgi:hypothetical protein